MRYLLVADGHEESVYRDEKGIAFDAFVRVSAGRQFLMGRTASHWIYTKRALAAMSDGYLETLRDQMARRYESEFISYEEYMDQFLEEME